MDFVDTSAWFAYFLPTDPDHERIRACFRSSRPLVSTDYCVDETLALSCALGGSFIARWRQDGEFFQEEIAQMHFVTADQIRRAWILFQQRALAGWSFTDCTSKVVIDELEIKTAVTIDAHFCQFGIDVIP